MDTALSRSRLGQALRDRASPERPLDEENVAINRLDPLVEQGHVALKAIERRTSGYFKTKDFALLFKEALMGFDAASEIGFAAVAHLVQSGKTVLALVMGGNDRLVIPQVRRKGLLGVENFRTQVLYTDIAGFTSGDAGDDSKPIPILIIKTHSNGPVFLAFEDLGNHSATAERDFLVKNLKPYLSGPASR